MKYSNLNKNGVCVLAYMYVVNLQKDYLNLQVLSRPLPGQVYNL